MFEKALLCTIVVDIRLIMIYLSRFIHSRSLLSYYDYKQTTIYTINNRKQHTLHGCSALLYKKTRLGHVNVKVNNDNQTMSIDVINDPGYKPHTVKNLNYYNLLMKHVDHVFKKCLDMICIVFTSKDCSSWSWSCGSSSWNCFIHVCVASVVPLRERMTAVFSVTCSTWPPLVSVLACGDL